MVKKTNKTRCYVFSFASNLNNISINKIFFFFLCFLFFSQWGFASNPVPIFHFPFDKNKEFDRVFKKNKLSPLKNLTVEALNKNITVIFPNNKTMHFYFDENGEIMESTTAEYRIDPPKVLFDKLDFDILVATSFGRRSYLINSQGEIAGEWGDEQSSYWCMGYCEKQSLIALADSNHSKIEIINSKTFEILYTIRGYVSTAVYIDTGFLYFTAETQRPGSDNGSHYKEHALYRFNLETKEIVQLTENNLMAPRGVSCYKNSIIVSETFKNEIKFFNKKTFDLEKIYTGFLMQNKIYVQDNRLLIADEHNHCIREIDLISDKESTYHTPIGLLLNPANVYEISAGIHKGKWLISDSENLRIVLLDPLTNKLTVLIENLNAALMVIPFNYKLNHST